MLIFGLIYSVFCAHMWRPVIVSACVIMNALKTMSLAVCIFIWYVAVKTLARWLIDTHGWRCLSDRWERCLWGRWIGKHLAATASREAVIHQMTVNSQSVWERRHDSSVNSELSVLDRRRDSSSDSEQPVSMIETSWFINQQWTVSIRYTSWFIKRQRTASRY